MSTAFVLPGPAGGVPAGFARIPAGVRVVRRHRPGKAPGWFGPAVGAIGDNRFDPPNPRRDDEPGVCYVAEQLGGAIHEGVLRGSRQPALSRHMLSTRHAITDAQVTRDLVLIDLIHEPGAHGVQLADLTERPRLRLPSSPANLLVYERTQRLVGTWLAQQAAAAFPVEGGVVDGIAYVSRFSPAQRCIALWSGAETALTWYTTVALGAHPELDATLHAMGISLLD
jgi:hypothetical protein